MIIDKFYKYITLLYIFKGDYIDKTSYSSDLWYYLSEITPCLSDHVIKLCH